MAISGYWYQWVILGLTQYQNKTQKIWTSESSYIFLFCLWLLNKQRPWWLPSISPERSCLILDFVHGKNNIKDAKIKKKKANILLFLQCFFLIISFTDFSEPLKDKCGLGSLKNPHAA